MDRFAVIKVKVPRETMLRDCVAGDKDNDFLRVADELPVCAYGLFHMKQCCEIAWRGIKITIFFEWLTNCLSVHTDLHVKYW